MPAALTWTTDPEDERVRGLRPISFASVQAQYITPAARADARRTSLQPPAEELFARMKRDGGWCITDVAACSAQTLRELYGYLAEPAFRRGVPLTIVADVALDELDDEAFVEADVGYAWSLQRMRHLVTTAAQPDREGAFEAEHAAHLDASQRAAVNAHDGVVQIIAPAGSGKTTVLIARVAELLRRGVPANRILCTTFNREARVEMQARLTARGLGEVRAQTFHSLGFTLLREERALRSGGVRALTLGQWRRLAALGQRQTRHGEWIEPPIAAAAIANLKLGEMVTPAQYAETVGDDPQERTISRIYQLYERELQAQRINDFDDLLIGALRRLRADRDLRERWQARFHHVLVDEYQDIEPAQEQLMQILAAPHDGLFCVGDEDQTLYGWRRASVERIVGLDRLYPGLQRVALSHNYRCPSQVVSLSRQVIENNKRRFPKEIRAVERREVPEDDRPVIHHAYPNQEAAAGDVARKLSLSERGQIVVLARTTRLLRMVAEACVPAQVKISAPEQIFEPAGARAALESYTRLLSDLRRAQPADVATVFRHPGRGLPFGAEERVAELMRDGLSFAQAIERVPEIASGARARVMQGADLLDRAARIQSDAAALIRLLRGRGGLDAHFEQYEQLGGGTEMVELEVLDDAEKQAQGMTVAQFAKLLTDRSDALRAIRDDQEGVELTTVHRAKGRQWPTVIVFGCDEEQLPHKRSLADHAKGEQDALEAERRVAYVAFTRAQQRLVVLTSEGNQSRFCVEASLVEPAPRKPDPDTRPARSSARPQTTYEVARRALQHRGADVALVLESCSSTSAARRVVAACLRAADAPEVEQLTVSSLLHMIPNLERRISKGILIEAGSVGPAQRVGQLGDVQRRKLAEAVKPKFDR